MSGFIAEIVWAAKIIENGMNFICSAALINNKKGKNYGKNVYQVCRF